MQNANILCWDHDFQFAFFKMCISNMETLVLLPPKAISASLTSGPDAFVLIASLSRLFSVLFTYLTYHNHVFLHFFSAFDAIDQLMKLSQPFSCSPRMSSPGCLPTLAYSPEGFYGPLFFPSVPGDSIFLPPL